MYEEHFGLSAPLLAAGIARDTQVFTGTRPLRVVGGRLAAALTRGNALVLLSGPAGSGKTTLAAHAARTHGTRLALGWIAHAPRRPHDLLEQLLVEFGVAPEHLSRAGLLQVWQQFLNEMAVTATSVCVLVEDADGLDPGVLRALESLTSADPNGCPGANLLLMSRESLVDRLRRPGLEGLAQRVNANLRLEPLDESGTADYLAFALAACGGRLDDIVHEDAVRALHERSEGIIRVIANLADNALALAAERGMSRLDAALVHEIAVELAGGAPPPAAAELPVLTDAVDAPHDELVRDVLAAGHDLQDADEAAAPPEPSTGDGPPPVAEEIVLETMPRYRAGVRDEPSREPEVACAGPDDDGGDEAEADAGDEQAETFEGLANALEFEDFSNLVAEKLFGEAELDELSQTLAVSSAAPRRKLTGT